MCAEALGDDVRRKFSRHPSRAHALDAYTKAYHGLEVFAYPIPGTKFWTPALGAGCMRSISMDGSASSISSSSSAFWGHWDGHVESLDNQADTYGEPRSKALEKRLAELGFAEKA